VQELQEQATHSNITFEVIVLDDASPDSGSIGENQKINHIENCRYELLPHNIGRSSIRNLLSQKAKFDWLLFLDADTIPVGKDFIAGYLPHLNTEEKVVYGGIKYQPDPPPGDMLLRWVYGIEREALPADVRTKNPYLGLLTLNFAIKRSVFQKVKFNESIPNLRHEDTLFSYNLSQHNIKVEHIANEVYHMGLDTSEIFIKKSEEAVVGLKYLLDNNLLRADYVRLAGIYKKIKAAGLGPLTVWGHKMLGNHFRSNLLSRQPSMFMFDLYRLGYLCSLK